MAVWQSWGVVLLLAVVSCQANDGEFFDGVDIFKQFNHEIDQIRKASREQAEHVVHSLSSMLDETRDREPLGDLDIEGADEDIETVPEVPGFSHNTFPGFFGMFQPGLAHQPWWKGPNVCVEREEIDESAQKGNDSTTEVETGDGDSGFFGAFEFSTCRQSEKRYTCTTKIRSHGIKKTLTVKYQCCHGHLRVPGKPGCTKVELKSLADTAVDLGAKDFIQMMKTANLEEKLNQSNLTLFAPSDEALRDFTDSMQSANQVEFFVAPTSSRRRRSVQGMSMKEIALGHITEGEFDVSEMVNEQILYSDNSNSTLRINIYPSNTGRIVTCNCARLIKPDNLAANGVVHIVDRVIPPVSKTLAELVSQDDQLGTLEEFLKKTDMMEMLSKPDHVTLFAPTDAAFKKLPEATLKRLTEGHSCLKNVLKHHIVPHSVCSEAIQSVITTANKGGDPIHIERRATGKLFVDDVEIVVKDMVATNGILHMIEEVIVPDSAKTLSEVLASNNHTKFLSLLKETDLVDVLDSMENITLFVPTDKALENPRVAAQLDSVRSDTDKLRNILLYHTAEPKTESCDLTNDLSLKSNMDDKTININLYAMQPFFMGFRQLATAQCARLLNIDSKACGGVIHTIDRLLIPPTQSILDQIYTDEQFTTLSSILKDTDLESTLKSNSPITFLAPVNEAFSDMEPEDLKHLQTDKEFAVKVLKKHVLPESVCCAGVQTAAWPFTSRVETMLGGSVAIRRDPDGGVHFGTTTVQKCDIMATNGLIHAVNRVMLPHNHGVRFNGGIRRAGNPNVDIVFYGL